ncbi:hypothetical protein ONV78_21145 [Hahella sp. CR1]|uniref:hypothetical protein n=1 Tax=Hahella sp. CR1 TaxID=2992807 RepID=UPI002441D134|nr:hypothetical protein [Hahella sp. CR1]MDG9670258.1 hypothetical protein [Hahella sp. CR1]
MDAINANRGHQVSAYERQDVDKSVSGSTSPLAGSSPKPVAPEAPVVNPQAAGASGEALRTSQPSETRSVEAHNAGFGSVSNESDYSQVISGLIEDSNKKFPLTEINARIILDKFVPEGFVPEAVAGPGGKGADLVTKGPDGEVFKIENKCTASARGFDKEISHAAQNQAEGCLVFVQVPEGTDAARWMGKFWGNRQTILNNHTPENVQKLEVYKNTDIVIYDDKGSELLPRQPIFNPDGKR